MAYPSVALFAERAMAVRSGFALNDDNAAAVVEICVRLDGLPLAIELAAARVKLLTPQAILARLGDRLALLAGGARDLPERQQTLRGAIDWSHDLLDETDQRLFARMSVFSGGASLEAVERVVPDPADAVAIDPVNGLSSLVDKSLIRQGETADGEPRFSTLETIREYGTERLTERGETRSTRDRHAAYYLGLFESAADKMLGPDQRMALDLFDRENDNLRTALAHAGETADALSALRLVAASWRFWQMRGFLIEGMDRARHALAIPGGDTDPAVRLKALDALGGLEYWHGDFGEAMTSYQGALDLAEQLGDASATAQQYYNLSFVHFGDPEAIKRAKDYAMRARDLFREIGDRGGEGRALWGLVNTTYYEKDLAQSEIWIEEALTIFRESDDQFMLAWALYMRGNIGALLGDRARVRADLREALQIFVATDDLSGYALLLDAFAVLDYVEGNSQRSMTLAGAANALQDWSGVSQLARLNRQWEGFFLDELLKDPELATAFEAGRQLSAGEAVALALTAESSGIDPDAPVYRAKLAPDPDAGVA
jgi:tetratricopeptide (TPR) repeat protein